MESFIIRIYRRKENEPRELVGISENVESQEKKYFKSFDELLPILSPSKCLKLAKKEQKSVPRARRKL